jgi:hypothetical protein
VGFFIPLPKNLAYSLGMRYLLAVIVVLTGLLVTGCSSGGITDEQIDRLIYEEALAEYNKCIRETNGWKCGDKPTNPNK